MGLRTVYLVLAGVAVGLHFLAQAIRQISADSRYREALWDAGRLLSDPVSRSIVELIGLSAGLALACFLPVRIPGGVRRILGDFRELSLRRREAILFAALVPLALRLSLAPIVPAPLPRFADEFGHLLAADTFASGRIANPPHVLWPHFETLYVLQQPAYASIYPVAQGLAMAAAKVAGLDSWFGVCGSVAAMCAAICWMLQGWVPLPWALAGALLAGLQVGVHSYWMNSYWGGAVAATGGALLMGALPRALARKRISAVLPMAAGLAILSQSRPFEGLLLSLPVGIALVIAVVRDMRARSFALLTRVVLPLTCAGAAILAGTLHYNWRVTGNSLLLPYQLHQRIYGTPQSLRFGSEVTDAPRAHVFTDIADNFAWQRDLFREQSTWRGLAARIRDKLKSFWSFFVGLSLTIPLLVFGLLGRKIRLLIFAALLPLAGVAVLYPFFFPHYVAPVYGAALGVAIYGLRRIRTLRFLGRPIGKRWFPWVLGSSAAGSATALAGWLILATATSAYQTPRSRIEAELKQRSGPHLVFVRYGPHHDFHKSWIYNAADIDHAPLVWARDLGDDRNEELLRYYAGRQAWLAEMDESPAVLTPYESRNRPRVNAVRNAAGASPYFKGGVTPGSIVTIYGKNLVRGVTGASTTPLFEIAPSSGNLFPSLKQIMSHVAPKPLNVDRTRIMFGSSPAPILAASNSGESESVTVQVPFSLIGTTAKLKVAFGDDEAVFDLPVLPANPGIFEVPATDGGLSGALLRPDGSLVSASNRARRGETIRMLVTGLGPEPLGRLIVGVNHRGVPLRWTERGAPSAGIDVVAFELPPEAPSGRAVPLSMAVVVGQKPVFSNNSTIAVE